MASPAAVAVDPVSTSVPHARPQSRSLTERIRHKMHAEGSFDVKASSLSADEIVAGTSIDPFRLDKLYHGDLDAAAKGVMLGAGKLVAGTAGYVAMERVTGKLHGRAGSFALQHFGTMDAGDSELNVRIVPGSGTGQLEGIAGTMTFANEAGRHSYALDFTLPE